MSNNSSIERLWCGKCQKFVYLFPGFDVCPKCGTPKICLSYSNSSPTDMPDFFKDLFK
jgi:rRNA maturation endonuclease Nob1